MAWPVRGAGRGGDREDKLRSGRPKIVDNAATPATTLFAALEFATGKVPDKRYERQGKAEFFGFMNTSLAHTLASGCASWLTTITLTSKSTSSSSWKRTRGSPCI